MAEFWLGTYAVNPPVAGTGSTAEPIIAPGAALLAIEVIRDNGEYAVLFSSVDDVDNPAKLQCRVGFANGTKACNAWRDRGFPLVDASIQYRNGKLDVASAHFANAQAMQYDSLLLSIDNLVFDKARAAGAQMSLLYEQCEQAPDSAWPATSIRRRNLSWQGNHVNVVPVAQPVLQLQVVGARSPSLRPFQSGPLPMAHAWSGDIALPQKPLRRAGQTQLASREDTFGVPAFRFQDVEVLGFRIDLPRDPALERQLQSLIAPLNFHLAAADTSVPDFRYRPATRTLLVELLRYGRMQLKTQQAPLTMLDYQSQHELLVRILVGRVDDDASEARDPAVFVPAIFVDNPWSKILGRDVQGFKKCIADFCVEEGTGLERLRPDGRPPQPGKPARPLRDICRVNLVDRTSGAAQQGGSPLLDLDCGADSPDGDVFQTMAAAAAMGGLSLVDARWRRFDLESLEYLGSFARTAMSQLFNGFRSVQVSPVGKIDLPKAWISGKFTVDDVVRVALPLGTARLSFHAPAQAPSGWKKVCALIAAAYDPLKPLDFHLGSWYRLKFSMNMTVDDGLEWTDEGALTRLWRL